MGSPAPVVKSFLFLALVLGSACTLNTDYFSEYRGKNLLASHGFGAAGAWSLVTDSTTAGWATTHGHSYAATDYMTWAAVGTGADAPYDTAASTSTLGPDGVSPAYRLEIKNLLTDGDFETDTLGASSAPHWTPLAGSSITIANATNDLSLLHPSNTVLTLLNSQFLVWDGSSGSKTLDFDVKTAMKPGLWMEGRYQFRYELVNLSPQIFLTVGFTTSDQSLNWSKNSILSASTPTKYSESWDPSFKTADLTSAHFSFGRSGSSDSVALDNVRMIKSDIDASVGLSFSSLSSGTLKLLPGTKSGAYTFTFYVRDDPTAAASPLATHRPNRLEPSGITVKISAAQKTANTLSPVFTPRPASGWLGWTKVTIDLGIDFVDTDADLAGNPALLIELSPTNTADYSTLGRDAGSLLVAQPVFTYNP